MCRATRELRQQCEALTGQADALRGSGLASEALALYQEALTIAEHLAEADRRHEVDVRRLQADIEGEQGAVQLARGWGASAVVHLDRALDGHLRLLRETSRRAEERQRALALSRALVVNADALMRYGDPQLAAASADAGFRGYLGQHATRGWTVNAMRAHATTASAILARAGRLETALEADAIAVKAAGETAEAGGSAGDGHGGRCRVADRRCRGGRSRPTNGAGSVLGGRTATRRSRLWHGQAAWP